MGTKSEPGRFDCYGKAKDDEPIFVLLARDPAAPKLIRAWVQHHQDAKTDGAKLMEALDVADQMERYLIKLNSQPQPPIISTEE